MSSNEWRYDPYPRPGDPDENPRTCEDCCFFDEAPRGGDGICTYWHDTQDSARYTWVTAGDNARECDKFQSI